jgi:FolB domain-containing protein
MDKIYIHGLQAQGIIGVNPDERLAARCILIDIDVVVDASQAAASDNIQDCVNYATLARNALKIAETSQHFTLEALAEDIAQMCLSDSRINEARIRVEKPGILDFVTSVGVEIYRRRSSI